MDILSAQAPFSFSPTSTNLTAQCLSNNLPTPTLFGAEILSVTSSLVSNYTAPYLPPSFFNSDPPMYGAATGLSFCNITVAYAHPGQNDTTNVHLWLPVSVSPNATKPDDPAAIAPSTTPAWNGLFLSLGGGGFLTGLPDIFSHSSLAQGYAISSTDGGHTGPSSEPWALISPGNVNLYLLQDFASVALHDMAVLGKAVVESFYSAAPRYSYFKGCSTGGRQGLMLAQRYPDDYDGILAAAPAIYMPKLMMSHYWAQMLMNQLGEYPHACELNAIHQAVIDECDDLDGVTDGVVSALDLCRFDPFKLVGTSISCTEQYEDADGDADNRENPSSSSKAPATATFPLNISLAAAQVAASVWRGPVDTNNNTLWHPLTLAAPLSNYAATKCFRNGTCTGSPGQLPTEWLRLFMYKDPSLTNTDLARLITHEIWTDLFRQSEELYHSFLATSDPDLGSFARRGGKMITWHGLSDEGIMPGQSRAYYDQVVALAAAKKHKNRSSGGSMSQGEGSPESGTTTKAAALLALNNVTEYYRLFLAPGVEHCGSGPGALPINVMAKLRDWVEHGIAPDILESESFPDGGVYSKKEDRVVPEAGVHDRDESRGGAANDNRREDNFGVDDTGGANHDHNHTPDDDHGGGSNNDKSDNSITPPKTEKFTRPLCMYPLVARYRGHGNTRRAENFECAESFF